MFFLVAALILFLPTTVLLVLAWPMGFFHLSVAFCAAPDLVGSMVSLPSSCAPSCFVQGHINRINHSAALQKSVLGFGFLLNHFVIRISWTSDFIA